MVMELYGPLPINRRLCSDPVWLEWGPFGKGQAYLDLIFLANRVPAKVMVNGGRYDLKAGQLAWSMTRLRKRWDWSPEKIKTFFEALRDECKITYTTDKRTTITTVLDYDSITLPPSTDQDTEQDTEPHTDPHTEPEAEPATEPILNSGISESLNQKPGIVEGARHKNAPTLQQAIEYFTTNGSGYSKDQITAVWNSFQATADPDNGWYFGKRVVQDWRAAMSTRLADFSAKKNSGPGSTWNNDEGQTKPPPGHRPTDFGQFL